jgi:hypothetical protein
MHRILKPLLGACLLISALRALGQTARQATTGPGPNEYHSPMVIETVFAAADRSLWDKKENKRYGRYWFTVTEYHDLGKFTCDGISITDPTEGDLWDRIKHEGQWASGLFMSAKELPGDKVDLGIRVKITNPKGNHDKRVTFTFEILNGDQIAASAVMKPIKIEEKSFGDDGKLYITLPTATALGATKFRITMTTENY